MDDYHTEYFLSDEIKEDLIDHGADPYHDGKGVPLEAIENGYNGTYGFGDNPLPKEAAKGIHELSKEYKEKFEVWEWEWMIDDDEHMAWMNEEVTIHGCTAERWEHLFPEDPFGRWMAARLLPSPKNWKY